ncbi:MAG: hypothetical protein ACT443_10075 [Gemmatimonadota bacterium]
MSARNFALAFGLVAALAQGAAAQERQAFAIGGVAQSYSFASGFGVESTALLIAPVAYTLPVTRQFTVDLYGAYAHGTVKLENATHTLQGIVDTRVRASLAVAPWAVLSAAVNLPTGNASHDSEEAIVANALSMELLGFREALWGTGFGFTSGIATASRIGDTGVGFGASYRVAGEFEPSSEQSLKYTPGNEARVRVALDQNIGAYNKLTFGITFQNYADDKVDGRNLFAPGNRIRGDLSYSFRASPASTWTIFVADVHREHGDVTLQLAQSGAVVGDTTFEAGQQNLAVAGFAGALRIGSLDLRPSADARLLTRESGEEEGWLAGIGTDIPFRAGTTEIVPSVRFSYGQLEGANTDERASFWGGELGLMLRWGGGR